ncbi:MAG: hypothetical protein IJF69_04725 [Clostridia bacterium]|nr:hypothetical protein [Clostridia bacterium]
MEKLKYPVLMVHGMGFRDNGLINYWGRIPRELKKLGCDIHYGYQDSNACVATNAAVLKRRIDEILQATGAEKVNIIAHSKGGLDARYAISTLGMGEKVASLTTMSTPHNGSVTVDRLLRFPDFLIRIGCFFVDCWYFILGDRKPATYRVIHSFKTSEARQFNIANPDDNRVYYQSYAFAMKGPSSDLFMWLTNLVVGAFEGENDGLLTPDGARWTNFKGVYRGVGRRGISHCDEVDMRRRPLSKKKGEGVCDIIDVYKEAVDELSRLGF